MSVAISIDVGGTFTDLAALDLEAAGPPLVHKRLTDAQQPARGVLVALGELLERVPGRIARVVHATTLPTNALLERRGACTALVTTAGFRDVLEIGTEQMYSIYDLFAARTTPLVPRGLRREVAERVSRDGEVLESLDEASAAAVLDELGEAGVESVAVCFLHAYKSPAHEQRFAAIAAARQPGLACSLSSRVAPVIGEYDRMSTVCVDAYLKPLVRRYVDELVQGLATLGVDAPLELVSSAGTVLSPAAAMEVPVRLLESGPAAGAFAAAWVGRTVGCEEALSLDVGGTTAKACLVEAGRPLVTRAFEANRARRLIPGSGIPVATPSVDLIEIGAGGGSIAYIDRLGLLKVGPESAGSDPGPACYGRGGSRPTATDADLVLGAIDPDRFLGGRMRLVPERAAAAIETHLAGPLGVSVLEAAWGVRAVLEEGMARAARTHLLERHRDPRTVALVAFGGAGPVHAVGVAEALGIRTVIVPAHAGVASALGALAAPRAVVVTRSHPCVAAACDRVTVDGIYRALMDDATGLLPEVANGARPLAAVDARFAGQFHELRVELDWPPTAGWPRLLEDRFRAHYLETYGRVIDGLSVEVLNWHATIELDHPSVPLAALAEAVESREPELDVGMRLAHLRSFADGAVQTPVYVRDRLAPGVRLRGPCLIAEDETTVVVPAAWMAHVHASRSLVVRAETR